MEPGEIHESGIGPGQVEAVQQLGGRRPGHRLVVDVVPGEEGPGHLIELLHRGAGQHVRDPSHGAAGPDRIARAVGNAPMRKATDLLEQVAADGLMARAGPWRQQHAMAQAVPLARRQQVRIVESPPLRVVDRDLVRVEVSGEADQRQLDALIVRIVPQGLKRVRQDGLVDQSAELPDRRR